MTTITYSNFRAHLAHFLDLAEEDSEEIVVTRGKGRTSIILSLDDFLSLQETAYLLSSKKNRLHLEKSLKEAAKGKTRTVRFS
ncbi:type II toxin-antitoxin system Phd/YefM family antitoxin [Candidatus Uhrbacteria bacterium]|nr:type II toxin-antitoxin system Phd/YefM family antitoxin [Candidatus Uhrbacteria bacterium]